MRGLCGLLLLMLLTGHMCEASMCVKNLNDTLTVHEGEQNNSAKEVQYTIVIDAGHGGRDLGCLGAHSREKEIALALALGFGERIKSANPNIAVVYTRDRDVFVPLHKRADIANAAHADLFVSIHCNYLPGHSEVHGSETYVMGLHTADHNLDVAKRENAAVRLEENTTSNYDFDPDSPAGHIILSMFQHAFLEQSIDAAECFEQKLGDRKGRRSRGVRQAGFLVLKETAMPSVLIETGYLSASTEEAYLLSEQGQRSTIDALYEGFKKYQRRQAAINSETAQAASVTQRKQSKKWSRDQEWIEDSRLSSKPVATPTQDTETTLQTQYYVQVAAGQNVISTDGEQWQALQAPVRYIKENGMYKYQVGPAATLQAAHDLLQEVGAAGFEGAWVVAYQGDQRVQLRQ